MNSSIVEWEAFSSAVSEHIKEYVIPQYGDMDRDEAHKYSNSELEKQIEKYVARFGRNSRGTKEQKRDLLKIAHYCCILHAKMSEHSSNIRKHDMDVQQLIDSIADAIHAWSEAQGVKDSK